MRNINKILITAALLISNSAYANTNINSVPSNHWSIKALEQLQSEGILDSFHTKDFIGDKYVDRMTLASVLASALANIETKLGGNSANISKESVSSLDRLAMEYADELAKMAIKYKGLNNDFKDLKEDVANLKWVVADINKYIDEDKKNNKKVVIGGDMLTRFTDMHRPHGNSGIHEAASLLRFKFIANIDENVKAVARWRLYNGLGTSGTWDSTGRHTTGIVDLAFLQINNKLGGNFTLGRTFSAVGHSLLINQYVDVARYTTDRGKTQYQINSYFKRKNGYDYNQVWNFGLGRTVKSHKMYANFYGQHGPSGYCLINKNNDADVKSSSRYDLEIGSSGKLGNNKHMSYDFSMVFTKLKQDMLVKSDINDNGIMGYAALNYDSKSDLKAKVSYFHADKKAHGGLFLGGDRRLACGPESPLEDIVRLDNLTGRQNNMLIDGDIHNFRDLKLQLEYVPERHNRNYFRVAYDFLDEVNEKVKGIDNSNPLGTDDGKADVITAEYRYKLSKNTSLKVGYSNFKYNGWLTKNVTKAGSGKNGRDYDYGLFWTELYSKF